MQVERIPIPTNEAGQRDEAAWHRLRAEDYTASEVGALFGVGQRSTALQVYVRKAGLVPDKAGTNYTDRGHVLEPVVAHRLTRRKWPGAVIRAADVYLRGRDPADPHMRVGATKDYDLELRGERLVLEIKTVAPRWFRQWWRGGGRWAPRPPDDVVLQVRTQAMLEDADAGMIAVLVADDSADIFAFRVERAPKIEAEIRRRVSDFWSAHAAGRLPRLEYGREAAALDALRRYLRTPTPILADQRLAELATAHTAAMRARAEADRQLARLEDEIRSRMGDNSAVLLPDARRVTVAPGAKRRVRIST